MQKLTNNNCLFFLSSLLLLVTSCNNKNQLETSSVNMVWKEQSDGWHLSDINWKDSQKLKPVFGSASEGPSGQYTFLYSEKAPASESDTIMYDNAGKQFPGEEYIYLFNKWKSVVSPVSMNTAGEEVSFYPETMEKKEGILVFSKETDLAKVEAEWKPATDFPEDILVNMKLTAKQAGWFSLASPTVATIPTSELEWGIVPGYYQGNSLNQDLILSLGYAQGLPEIPYICQDKTITTPSAFITNKQNTTLSVILEPGQTRHPWAKDGDESTHNNNRTGFSHMNRSGELSPTAYVPLLSSSEAELKIGDEITAQFRISLSQKGWFEALKHAMDDIYQTTDKLAIKKNTQSLSRRVERMLDYSLDDKTSMWQKDVFQGVKLGAQSYLGTVIGADKDAIKNSDIGAMWMMAELTNNEELKEKRLPLVRNFKMMQQEPNKGFFYGAARGQYYLMKSDRWVEEWGSHIEPTGLMYYTLCDLGNILLFETEDKELKDMFRAGADRLLEWQQPEGNWVVGYDHKTDEPVFNDLSDVRPTFYGLIAAYRILGDEKYLRAAQKGADWILENAVEKGHFLGVCGDVRFVNDFATAQIGQGLLDLWEITGDEKYLDGAVKTAKMYTTSIYAHPVPTEKERLVKGRELKDWQVTQAGLNFEHGGTIGSATGAGPILLASHAGYFLRIAQITKDPFFANVARAAAWGRDAFVNPETSVASYYWRSFNNGSGRFPHHAWWQIGWLMDYLVTEAEYRSNGAITFPSGFMTAKVGPHQPFGFEEGSIYGDSVSLSFHPEMVGIKNPSVDVLTAKGVDNSFYFIFLQDATDALNESVELKMESIFGDQAFKAEWYNPTQKVYEEATLENNSVILEIDGVGLKVLRCKLE